MRASQKNSLIEPLEPRVVLSVYYVSPLGSDADPGGLSAPWKTLQRAADAVIAGDTVHVLPGTYDEGMNLYGKDGGDIAAPIAFLAEPGVVITHCATEGVNADLAGINIENAGGWYVIHGFTIIGDGSMQRAGIRVTGSDHTCVSNNSIQDAFIGIFTSDSDNLLIDGNTCANSTDQHGIYMSANEHDCVVRGNSLYGNNWDGLHMNASNGAPNDGAIVEKNVIYENGLSGMDIEGVTNATFSNNIIYSNEKHGITIHSQDQPNTPRAANDTFVNNTIVDNGLFAIQVRPEDTNGQTFFNDVLLSSSAGYGSIGVSGTPNGLLSDYNVVMDSFSVDLGTNAIGLAQWSAQTGQDQHSVIAQQSQLFLDPAGRDYHLLANSAAIDAGYPNLGSGFAPTTDFDGASRPQGRNWDIGANERPAPPDSTPPLISNIAMAAVKSNKATITWTTDEPTTARVDYGLDSTYGSSVVPTSALVIEHQVPLTGLSPATPYHFRVVSQDASGNTSVSQDFILQTAPPDTSPPLISSVNVTSTTPTTAIIEWSTDEESTSQVVHGFSSNYGRVSQVDAALVASHRVMLGGLLPGTVFHFAVRSADEFGNLTTSGDFTFTTTAAVGRPDGAVAFWSFDQSSGNTILDDTGNAHDGTLFNGASLMPDGIAGHAASFDGVDDYIRVPRALALEPAKLTLSAWIKLPESVESDWASIIKKTYTDDNPPIYGSYSLSLSPSGASNILGFFTGSDSGGDELNSPTPIPTGQWVHVAATFDPETQLKNLYVDGVLVASDQTDEPLVYDTSPTGDIYIGQDPGPEEAFEGSIDDVGIWDRVLSDGEIAAMAYPGITRTIAGTSGADTIVATRVGPQQLQVQVGHQQPINLDLTALNYIEIDGGGGTDTIVFVDSQANDDVLIGSGGISFGSNVITEKGVERVVFDGEDSSPSLSIDAASARLVTDQTLAGLAIVNGGTLDVANAMLRVIYPADAVSPVSALNSLVRSGWNGGAWNGTGIITSIGANFLGLGIRDDVSNHEVEVKNTPYGDANLDGRVDTLDFTMLAAHFGSSGAVWEEADFNYDTKINALDFGSLATNYGMNATSTALLESQSSHAATVNVDAPDLFSRSKVQAWNRPMALLTS